MRKPFNLLKGLSESGNTTMSREAKASGEMKNVKKSRSFQHNPNNYLRDSSKTSSFLSEENSKAVQAKKSVR